MNANIWTIEPMELIQSFERKSQNPSAGALIAWAVWSVDSLHYLNDLDKNISELPSVNANHSPDIMDISHARWATSTCITSLDLCAAGLGRAYCDNNGQNEYDLGYFDYKNRNSNKTKIDIRRNKLPNIVQNWLDNVLANPDYNVIKNARDWFTHSRIKRHFHFSKEGHERIRLELPSGKIPVRKIIEISCELATNHVTIFLQNLMKC